MKSFLRRCQPTEDLTAFPSALSWLAGDASVRGAGGLPGCLLEKLAGDPRHEQPHPIEGPGREHAGDASPAALRHEAEPV